MVSSCSTILAISGTVGRWSGDVSVSSAYGIGDVMAFEAVEYHWPINDGNTGRRSTALRHGGI